MMKTMTDFFFSFFFDDDRLWFWLKHSNLEAGEGEGSLLEAILSQRGGAGLVVVDHHHHHWRMIAVKIRKSVNDDDEPGTEPVLIATTMVCSDRPRHIHLRPGFPQRVLKASSALIIITALFK